MNYQNVVSIGLAVAVMLVGIGSLVTLGSQPESSPRVIEQNLEGIVLAAPSTVEARALTTLVGSEDWLTAPLTATVAMPTVTPTPAATPLPPLALPAASVPAEGQAYLLTPVNPQAVGWARANDEIANHLGDYNIFAGVLDGLPHVGVVQFDLTAIPPGSPIIYADLTLTGLDSDWLVADGVWQAQMLAPWINDQWTERNFHWWTRADSGTVWLEGTASGADLAVGAANTFFMPPDGLALLEAQLFAGKVAFRMTGSVTGQNALFAWDSGFGAESLGRTPVLRVVTGGPAPAVPPPSPTPAYVIITPTSTDETALVALAAERLAATAAAPPVADDGTPLPTPTATPLPPNWVTPVIVVNTPVPANGATAVWQAQVATAQAVVHGTATPLPPNIWTATPTTGPTPTPQVVAYALLTATPTPTVTPEGLPAILQGKILFYSDRNGGTTLMLMDPDGSNVAVWTGGAPDWIYVQATQNADMAPTGDQRVVVSSEQISNLQLWTLDLNTGLRQQITSFEDVAYDPVWSPVGNQIAFVSPDPGNDEIYIVQADGSNLQRLTTNVWEWDKHPSWSPDGAQIVFWSNRESSRKQIWIMQADGSNPRNLSNNSYNDWDPVWVK